MTRERKVGGGPIFTGHLLKFCKSVALRPEAWLQAFIVWKGWDLGFLVGNGSGGRTLAGVPPVFFYSMTLPCALTLEVLCKQTMQMVLIESKIFR